MEISEEVLKKALTASFTQNQIYSMDWGKIVLREMLPKFIDDTLENIEHFNE